VWGDDAGWANFEHFFTAEEIEAEAAAAGFAVAAHEHGGERGLLALRR
jgi:hypothetical protein